MTHQLHRCFKIFVALACKSDNEVRRERNIGLSFAHLANNFAILVCRVATVHGFQNPIRAGLHRQVQERLHLWRVTMRRDQVIIHVTRMAGCITNTFNAADLGKVPTKLSQGPVFPALYLGAAP